MSEKPPTWQIIAAYAIVYIVWGSTYYFIQLAVDEIPPALMGAVRFLLAGSIMLAWVAGKREPIFEKTTILRAFIGGVLLLFVGNGVVMYTEQFIPSAVVAIVVSATPIWFVLFDRPAWKVNLKSPLIILGTLVGFAGVVLLLRGDLPSRINGYSIDLWAVSLLMLAPASWAIGSLFAKYYPGKASVSLTTAWQMLGAGFCFLLLFLGDGSMQQIDYQEISLKAWLALLYLVIFGSIAGYSAYVWLLQVEPTSRASTYAYVNPIVAVLMGMLFAGETVGLNQWLGLAVILGSVLLINKQKYRSDVSN